MRSRSVRWGFVLSCGWVVILVAAAIILLSLDSWQAPVAVVAVLVVDVWLVVTTLAFCRYLYRGWQRVPLVPNKAAYVTWLSFETLAAVGIYALLAVVMFAPELDGPHSRQYANEAAAVSKLRTVVTLETKYAAAHSEKGFACELSLLRTSEQTRADDYDALSFLVKPTHAGYKFTLGNCYANTQGVVVHYQASAVPVESGRTGFRAFCTDDSGLLWYDAGGSATNCLASRRSLE